jgi:ADP-heptose:LPS heptosyltransferase
MDFTPQLNLALYSAFFTILLYNFFMNILAINFGGIGDEIFFLPTLISLKKEFPNSKITLALEPRSKSVKDLTNVIDDLILVDIKEKNKYFELLKLVFHAWGGRFDMVISSGGNKLISILLFLTGIKKRYGYDTGKLSQILLTKAVPLNKNQYACAMYHDLISPVTDIKTDLPEINVDAQEKIPNSVLIHPGVSKMSIKKGMTKTISADVWAEVVKLLLEKGKNVILAGGPDDEEVIGEIEKDLAVESGKWKVESLSLHTPSPDGEGWDGVISTENSPLINMYGKTKSLKDLAILIGKAEKFICSDSAPLHVAVAMKTKTYPIFGPTDDKKLIPQSDLVVPIKANDNCPIKPCLWEHRQTTCENLDCLKITANEIVKFVCD